MESVTNKFTFIGEVVSDAYGEIDSHNVVARFVAKIKDNNKIVKLPFIAFGTIARKLLVLSRKGNVVLIKGMVDTKDYFDKVNGETKIRVYFVCTDFKLLKKGDKKMKLLEKNYSELVEMYSPDVKKFYGDNND